MSCDRSTRISTRPDNALVLSKAVLQMKPLGQKTYGSIPHLTGSRLGLKDYVANPGHEEILTKKARKGDTIVIEEKLDGSCCAVANIKGEIVPLTRAGWRAESSPYRQHHVFANWTYARQSYFLDALRDGERLVGEWLLQAHSIKYKISDPRYLFRPFDLMNGTKRAGRYWVDRASAMVDLTPVLLLHSGKPLSVAEVVKMLPKDSEGAVWRCENKRFGVELLAKYVRSDHMSGRYLTSVTGSEEVWNYSPELAAELS